MTVQIQIRRDTTTNWQLTNPVLGAGEPGFDTTAQIFKIGDGITPWTELQEFTHVNAFATVATTGSYDDLTDKPIIPEPVPQIQSSWTQTNPNAVSFIANKPTLSTVATSGSYNDLADKPTILTTASFATVASSGEYSDLLNKPTLFSGSYIDLSNKPTYATVATTGAYSDLTGKPTYSTVATTGSYTDLLDKPTLLTLASFATVATTGAYSDLTGKPTLFSGNYNDLANKPSFATVATTGSYTNLLDKPTYATVATTGSYNDLTNKPTIPDLATLATVASTGVYSDLTGKPTLFSGSYTDLANKPTFATVATTGAYSDLTGKPTLATVATSGSYTDLINKPTFNFATVATTGSYSDLTNKPSLFSGSYTDLTNKPTILTAAQLAAVALTGSYADLANKPTLFSGSYNDLTNKPTFTTSLTGLTDVIITSPSAGEVLKYDGNRWVNGSVTSTNTSLTVYWNDVLNKPLFATTGSYTDLTNKPTLSTVAGTGSYADLLNKPTLFSGAYVDLTGKPSFATVATSGSYADLTNKPTLFSGSYNDLTNKPTLLTLASFATVATTGSYNDLTNKPTFTTSLTGLTDVSISSLSAGQILKYDGTRWVNGTESGTNGPGTIEWNDVLNKPTFATVATTGSYDDLSDTPTLATVATSGLYTDLTGKPTLATVATSGSYADLTNKPTLFSGAYTDLTGKPTLATVATSGSYNDLANLPTLFSGVYTDLINKPTLAAVATSGSYTSLTNRPTFATVATSGSYADLTNKPTLFSGAYVDLTGKPTFATVATTGSYADIAGKPTLATVATTGAYSDLIGKPTLFSGSYNDLTNKPTFTTSLTGLTDVEITSATTGQILKFNGTKWINDADLTGGTVSGTVAWTDVQNKPSFATVATSGLYTDLNGKPTLATSITARSGTVYQVPGIGGIDVSVGYTDILNLPTLSTNITIRNQTAIQVSGTKNGNVVKALVTPRIGSDTNTPVTSITARTGIIQIPDGVSFSATNDFNKLVNTPYTSVFRYLTTAEIADVQSGTQLIDLTAKLQYALTNNIDVYFPAGTYAIAGTLTISNANTTITADKAVLVRKPGVATAVKMLVVNASNVTIKGMAFDYNSKVGNGDTTPLVRVQQPYATFDGCTFTTVATTDNTYQTTIRTIAGATNCTVKNCKFNGGIVACNNTDGFVFDNNTMVGGIDINALSATTTHSNDCRITNNYIEVMPSSVVGANPAAMSVISRDASQPPRNLLISNNTFVARSNLLFFLTIDTTNGSVINNNTFRTIGAVTMPYGIELVRSDNVVFDGNILDFTSLTTPSSAVILNNTRTSAVTNNSISFGSTIPHVGGDVAVGVMLLAPVAGNKSDNNLISDNIISIPSEGYCVNLVTNAANTSVSRNIIRDNQLKVYTTPWTTDPSDATVAYPTLADQSTSSYSRGVGFDCIGTNATVDSNVVSGNTIHSTYYGFRAYQTTNTVITDNTVVNVHTTLENVNLSNSNLFVKYNSWQGDAGDSTTIFTAGFTASNVTGLFVYTGTADATVTLPIITSDLGGRQYRFYNSTAYNLTITRSSSQLFKETATSTSGITGYIIPTGAYVDVVSVYSSGSIFWLVRENQGASSIVPMGELAAARLLTQGTFGPTIDTLASTAAMSYDQWFNYQKSIPRTKTFMERCLVGHADEQSFNARPWRGFWWTDIIKDEDQLLQRMAFALSEIFVTNDSSSTWSQPTAYLDLLYRNALGNFRTLIEEVTYNSSMGSFLNTKNNYAYYILMYKTGTTTFGSTTLTMPDLNHNGPGYSVSGTTIQPGKRVVGVNIPPNTTIVSVDSATNKITLSNPAIATGSALVFICDPNAKQRPDENYAREVMQLFSIGLWMLNNDGTRKLKNGESYATYDQEVVTQTSKVFTGWRDDGFTYQQRTGTPLTVTQVANTGVGGTSVFTTSTPHGFTIDTPVLFGNGTTLPVPSSQLTTRSFAPSVDLSLQRYAAGVITFPTGGGIRILNYVSGVTFVPTVGMELTVVGTLAATATGSITGYVDGKTYKITNVVIDTVNKWVNLTVTNLDDSAVTINVGSTTGLTFLITNCYFVTKKNFSATTFSVSRVPLVIGYAEILPGGSDTPISITPTTTSFSVAKYYTGYEALDRTAAKPMITSYTDERHHDPREKYTIGMGGEGTTTYIPESGTAGMSAADITRFLDILCSHPNVGPFISYQLIQRLVTSNPTPEYVDRVATVFNDNGKGVRGDLFAVAKAILTDIEATTPTTLDHAKLKSSYGKLREPVLRVSQMWRAFSAQTNNGDLRDQYIARTASSSDSLSQNILSAPTVFNFFTPDYTRAGTISASDIVAPEFQITGEQQQTRAENTIFSGMYRWFVPNVSFSGSTITMSDSIFYPGKFNRYTQYEQHGGRTTNTVLDAADDPINYWYYAYNNLTQWLPLARTDVPGLIDKMNLVLMAGQMPTYMRTLLINYISKFANPGSTTDYSLYNWNPTEWSSVVAKYGSDGYAYVRVVEAAATILLSPQCAIQR